MITLHLGRTYRAKQPGPAGHQCVNDRQIIHIMGSLVGYIDPSSEIKVVTSTYEEFQKWAERDVTAELPPNGWAPYTKGVK